MHVLSVLYQAWINTELWEQKMIVISLSFSIKILFDNTFHHSMVGTEREGSRERKKETIGEMGPYRQIFVAP